MFDLLSLIPPGLFSQVICMTNTSQTDNQILMIRESIQPGKETGLPGQPKQTGSPCTPDPTRQVRDTGEGLGQKPRDDAQSLDRGEVCEGEQPACSGQGDAATEKGKEAASGG